MAYQDNVLAMMVSDLYTLIGSVAPSSSGAGSGLGVSGTIANPPEHFGVPENIPEETYIVQALTGDNGFISSAVQYHTTYGLNPVTINSLEHLVHLLRARSTHFDRMRLVGHVGLDTTTNIANLNVAFFNGGQRFVPKEMLIGFGTSDELGLRAILDPTTFESPTEPYIADLIEEVIKMVRVKDTALLTTFGLHTSHAPTGDLARYVEACVDLLAVQFSAIAGFVEITNNGTPITATQRGYLTAVLNRIRTSVRTRLVNATPAHATPLDRLHTEIMALSPWLVSTRFPIYTNVVSGLLFGIRNGATPTLLDPLGLASTAPTGDVEKFFFAVSDLWFAQHSFAGTSGSGLLLDGQVLTGAQQSAVLAALNARVTHFISVISASGTPSATAVRDLKDAMLLLTPAEMHVTLSGDFTYGSPATRGFTSRNNLDRFNLMHEADQALGRTFRADITAAKARFDSNSWVDIRGCRIGQDTDYMDALRVFFGRTDNRPKLSGPEWFQKFPFPGYSGLNTEADMDTAWGTGTTAPVAHSSAEIQAAFLKAGPGVGTDTHIAFWKLVAALTDFEFAAMEWKGSLPDLPVDPPRLTNFATGNFTATITTIGRIFNITITPALTTALTRIQARHTHIFALQSEITAIAAMGNSPAAAVLAASFTRLQGINTGLGITVVPATAPGTLTITILQEYTVRLRMHVRIVTIAGGPVGLFNAWLATEALAAQSSPPAADVTAQYNALVALQTSIGATGIIPATEPAVSVLLTNAESLVAHVENASALHLFKTAVHAKADHNSGVDELAQFRYYLHIGLALLVDKEGAESYYVMTGIHNEAIRVFMRSQWQGTMPSGSSIATAAISTDNARQVSLLNEGDTTTDIGINPYPEFNDHIVKRP